MFVDYTAKTLELSDCNETVFSDKIYNQNKAACLYIT